MSYLAHPWRCMIAGLLLATASISARAATCAYTPQTPTPATFVANLGGSITVGRDVPVGTEIYRATFYSGAVPTLSCPAGSYTQARRYVTSPGIPSGLVLPGRGPIYRTPVPGIGYAAWYAGNGLPYTNQPTFAVTTVYYLNASLDVSFYKIGDVTPGTISASDMPQVEQVMTGDSSVRANIWQYVGALNIVGRTCTTPDVTVDLGDHLTTELGAVGTATKWVDVTLSLQNCPAYYGAFRRDLTDDSGFRTTNSTANQLQYRVDATTTIIDTNRSVMALSNATAPGTATGMGIQVVDANESPVGFGTTRASGLSLAAVDGRSYTIPLKARYMQTAADVTAGTANGQATVTFIYQ